MKSKAHSKKCMDLGVSVALIDDQDGEEEFGKKLKSSCFTAFCIYFVIPVSYPFISKDFKFFIANRYRDEKLRS